MTTLDAMSDRDPKVRVLAMKCLKCGYESPGLVDLFGTFTPYPVLRTFAQVRAYSSLVGHSDGLRVYRRVCDGQMQIEMEPAVAALTATREGDTR